MSSRPATSRSEKSSRVTTSVAVYDTRRGRTSDTRSAAIVSGGFKRFDFNDAIAVSDSREQDLHGYYAAFALKY